MKNLWRKFTHLINDCTDGKQIPGRHIVEIIEKNNKPNVRLKGKWNVFKCDKCADFFIKIPGALGRTHK